MGNRIIQALGQRWLLWCLVVLALVCLALFYFRRGGQSVDPRVGSYSLISLTVDGREDAALTKREMERYSLTLRRNGTGTLVIGDGVLNLTWDESSLYDPQGAPIPYLYEDGVLSFQNGSVSLVFRKQNNPESKN